VRKTCITTIKKFRTYLPAQYFDAPLWLIQRWFEKGLVEYTKDGWVEIRSKNLLADVRDEPGLIEFVVNCWNASHDVTTLNLHDCFREQQWKAELRAEGRDSEVEAMERDRTMNSDADLNKWIKRCCMALDKLEAEMSAFDEIEQAHKTKLAEASADASVTDQIKALTKATMVVETLDASKVA
jgi:hypothetical protein